MNAYIDSSVLLRVILRQPSTLSEWPQLSRGTTSALAEVECARTLDWYYRTGVLDTASLAERREWTAVLLRDLDLLAIDGPTLSRAAGPFPTIVGTLDAIHLATALLWREAEEPEGFFATHDQALGLAARAMGFAVLGL